MAIGHSTIKVLHLTFTTYLTVYHCVFIVSRTGDFYYAKIFLMMMTNKKRHEMPVSMVTLKGQGLIFDIPFR